MLFRSKLTIFLVVQHQPKPFPVIMFQAQYLAHLAMSQLQFEIDELSQSKYSVHPKRRLHSGFLTVGIDHVCNQCQKSKTQSF